MDFAQWQWRRLQTWQRGYLLGALLFGMGLGLPDPYGTYVIAVPVSAWFGFFGKWWVWDPLKASWAKYQTEKRELFSTIKKSDL